MATFVKLLCVASIFIWQTSTTANKTLTNTKWYGTFNVAWPMSGMLEFKKDTALLSIEGEVVEFKTYREKDTRLFFRKYMDKAPAAKKLAITNTR